MIVGVSLMDDQLIFIQENDKDPRKRLVDCISGYIKCYYMKYRQLDYATLSFATNGHVTANEKRFIFLDGIETGILDLDEPRMVVWIPYHEDNVPFLDLLRPIIDDHWDEIEPLQQAIIERMKFEFA